MREEVRELYKYRELLFMIAYRDVRVRYRQSFMGFLWALLMPVLVVAAGMLVRYAYAIVSNKPLALADFAAVAAKSVPWAFLISSIRFSCQSLTGNPNLVTKVYFPKEIFPLAAVLSQLFDLLVAGTALTVLLGVARIGLTVQLFWVVPLLAIMVVLAGGIGLLVSAGSLFFRDVKYIVEVVLSFAIFFTPVFYEVSILGPKGRFLLINPVAPLLEGLASVVRGRAPDEGLILYSFSFATVMIVFAYMLFKKVEPMFAESI